MKLKQYSLILLFTAALSFTACSSSLPDTYQTLQEQPQIYPDYLGVTVPANIAPLHFVIDEEGEEYRARISANGEEWIGNRKEICPGTKVWHKMLAAAKGGGISVEVYVKREGKWEGYQRFTIEVAEEEIDPYISYRLIAPSYVAYEELTLNQRNLTNFEERVMYNNMLNSTEAEGQCINCHAYQNYNAERMQFHARQNKGGTLIAYDGKMSKVNLKTDSTISAGVYPAWHPTLPFIAYSTNTTGQSFHTKHSNKIEVQDSESDLIFYDIERNEVSYVARDSFELEVFPAWSPDGKYLYYCSAYYRPETDNVVFEHIKHFKEIKYSLYRKAFDEKSRTFGPREMVFDAASQGMSATLPRISPNGRYLMFTLGEYGCFHIWHKDAELYLMDLHTMEARCMSEVNSDDVESYHSWSSNGRWVIFSSRRYDGGFTRPYIAYIDANGMGRKAFELPQQKPNLHRELMKSYNIPEFTQQAIRTNPHEFAKALQQEAKSATFVETP